MTLEQCVSQTLRRGTSNGITELLLLVILTAGTTYIPRAAITFGIGPHSVYFIQQSLLSVMKTQLKACLQMHPRTRRIISFVVDSTKV